VTRTKANEDEKRRPSLELAITVLVDVEALAEVGALTVVIAIVVEPLVALLLELLVDTLEVIELMDEVVTLVMLATLVELVEVVEVVEVVTEALTEALLEDELAEAEP